MSHFKKQLGFTIVEIIMALAIFGTVIIITASAFMQYSASERRLNIENELYEETRFTLEKIVKEFREGTIDYEEYWNSAGSNCSNYFPGKCYGAYANTFTNGSNTPNNAISAFSQSNLYVINESGTKKILLKKDSSTNRLQILRLNGYDADFNGIIDKWVCSSNFKCNGSYSDGTMSSGRQPSSATDGFEPYSPSTLNITNLTFYLAPLDDPYKAFAENDKQFQPHVTIKITAKLADDKYKGVPGQNPTITLQTTISARAFAEVKAKQK